MCVTGARWPRLPHPLCGRQDTVRIQGRHQRGSGQDDAGLTPEQLARRDGGEPSQQEPAWDPDAEILNRHEEGMGGVVRPDGGPLSDRYLNAKRSLDEDPETVEASRDDQNNATTARNEDGHTAPPSQGRHQRGSGQNDAGLTPEQLTRRDAAASAADGDVEAAPGARGPVLHPLGPEL